MSLESIFEIVTVYRVFFEGLSSHRAVHSRGVGRCENRCSDGDEEGNEERGGSNLLVQFKSGSQILQRGVADGRQVSTSCQIHSMVGSLNYRDTCFEFQLIYIGVKNCIACHSLN